MNSKLNFFLRFLKREEEEEEVEEEEGLKNTLMQEANKEITKWSLNQKKTLDLRTVLIISQILNSL